MADWVRVLGTGSTTAAINSPAAPGRVESPAAKIARLETRVAELEAERKKINTEKSILRQAAKYFAGGDELVSRFQFVADHRYAFEVKRLCKIMGINRSSFYAWEAA